MNKNLSLSLQLILIGCLTFFIHELVHFLAHLSLGHTVNFNINHIDLIQPKKIMDNWKQAWVSGSGAFFTFFQGFVAFLMLKKKSSRFWFNVLLSAFVLRLAAALLAIIKSSDEIKTSIAMGLPSYFWTSIVLLGLLYLIFKAKNKIGLKPRIILIHFTLLVIVTYLFSLI